jgi:hypothetical protein
MRSIAGELGTTAGVYWAWGDCGIGFASIAAARLTERLDKRGRREETRSAALTVSVEVEEEVVWVVLGCVCGGGGQGTMRKPAGTGRSKSGVAPLKIAGSKERPAKKSDSPRAILGVAGRAWF